MDNGSTQGAPQDSVYVEFRDDKWWVVIHENGERHDHDFEAEAHASSYADGQRIRLGVYKVVKPME